MSVNLSKKVVVMADYFGFLLLFHLWWYRFAALWILFNFLHRFTENCQRPLLHLMILLN